MRAIGIILAALALGGAASASSARELPPRLTVSAKGLRANDTLTLRVVRPAGSERRELRLYLVPVAAGTPRSRFDERLHYLGSVPSRPGARAVVTVPPLDAGRYRLSYWCRGCLPRVDGVGIPASPVLSFEAPRGGECPVTTPNGSRPPGSPSSAWRFHGNGWLWALMPPDGVITTNALGGHKQLWVGRVWVGAPVTVRYRPFGDPSTPFTTASVVSGTLGGYDGPSWASRMAFTPGCWQIAARQLDVSLSYVARVVVPDPGP